MTSFGEGENRYQSTLFPERLEGFVLEDNAVRVIDVFINELDLSGPGFKAEPSELGSPAYHAATLLKIYIYGYLNQIRTIADLRKDHADWRGTHHLLQCLPR